MAEPIKPAAPVKKIRIIISPLLHFMTMTAFAASVKSKIGD
jgi:hypothetical protein